MEFWFTENFLRCSQYCILWSLYVSITILTTKLFLPNVFGCCDWNQIKEKSILKMYFEQTGKVWILFCPGFSFQDGYMNYSVFIKQRQGLFHRSFLSYYHFPECWRQIWASHFVANTLIRLVSLKLGNVFQEGWDWQLLWNCLHGWRLTEGGKNCWG